MSSLTYTAIDYSDISFLLEILTKIEGGTLPFIILPLKDGYGKLEFKKDNSLIITGRKAVYLAIALELSFNNTLIPKTGDNDMDQWLDFSTSFLTDSLQRGGIDLLQENVFDPLQSNLAGRVFLSGSINPTIADWVLYSRLRNLIKAMVPSHAFKYFRIIRWINHLESLLGNCDGIFDMKELKKLLSLTTTSSSLSVDRSSSVSQTSLIIDNSKKVKSTKTSSSGIPISRIDLRVGKITKIHKHPNASRLYVESVDFGLIKESTGIEREERTIVSGLVDHCEMEELEGRLCLFVCNLKPASLCKVMSSGMLLVAKERGESEGFKLEPLIIDNNLVKAGDRVTIEGITCCPDDIISTSKSGNLWDIAKSQLEVIDGVVYWMGEEGSASSFDKKVKLLINGTEIRSIKVPNGIVS